MYSIQQYTHSSLQWQKKSELENTIKLHVHWKDRNTIPPTSLSTRNLKRRSKKVHPYLAINLEILRPALQADTDRQDASQEARMIWKRIQKGARDNIKEEYKLGKK